MKTLPMLCTVLAAPLAAQDLLFTTTQQETTMSGSAGTSLQFVYPNEIVHLPFCGPSAEKWSPRACFQTMAGDADADANYWEATLLGRVDALLTVFPTVGGPPNQRSIFYSPSQSLGTAVSGAPGLRPGDVGRIRRIGALDGQIEYFIRAEQVQMALGLPPSPVVVDVDAVAAQPNFGVLLSLDTDVVANLCSSGPTLIRDGDVVLIPPAAMAWTPAMTVAMVVPGGAVVAITEAQMDLMVVNASVTDRDGICVGAILDTDALELDNTGSILWTVPSCTGPVPVPQLLFAGESLTGGAILNTLGGGSIHTLPCGPLGTTCTFGPTLGTQIGLRPPTAAQGIASSVNALATTRAFRFVSESPVPQTPVGTPAIVDFGSPGALTWVFLTFAPGGPGAVPASTPFVWGTFGFPDYFPAPFFMGVIGTATGFGTYTSPPVPWPADLLFQGVTITPWGTIEASTPTIVEVF